MFNRFFGGLPLALDQAGAYLEETGIDLASYAHLYQQHRAILLSERRGLVTDHLAPVAVTWSLSFEHVQKKNAAAAQLLRMAAFLAPDAIPEELFKDIRPCFWEQDQLRLSKAPRSLLERLCSL